MKSNRYWELLGVIVLFIIGVCFRMWFITLAPQPFRFGLDGFEYESYAQKIWDNKFFAAHSYRSYPYPLLLAIVYLFVGWGNHQAIFFLQAVMDTSVGLFLFYIFRKGLMMRTVGFLAYALYTINPFTSGYVGVILAEVMTTFFIGATFFSGVFFVKKPSVFRGILFGFCVGMAAETRNAAFIWAAIPIGLSFWGVFSRKTIVSFVSLFVGLSLTVVYPLLTNWKTYEEINFTTVDDFYIKEIYQGVYLKILPPFTYAYPVESQELWGEYYSEYDPGRTKDQREAMRNKYLEKTKVLIEKDPIDYLLWRFRKMWYVWQKENVFFYEEPNFEYHRPYTYSYNVMILGLALLGLIYWDKTMYGNTEKVIQIRRFIRLTCIGTILYATLAFSLTHAEYRLTIPFYPTLFAAMAVGIAYPLKKLLRKRTLV